MASAAILFGLEQIEADSGADTTLIFKEINKELEEHLLEQSINTDSTDGVFDFLEALTNCVQEDFGELIGEGSDKKRFVRALFALLLNTKVDIADKIKEILKIAVETTLKTWREQK